MRGDISACPCGYATSDTLSNCTRCFFLFTKREGKKEYLKKRENFKRNSVRTLLHCRLPVWRLNHASLRADPPAEPLRRRSPQFKPRARRLTFWRRQHFRRPRRAGRRRPVRRAAKPCRPGGRRFWLWRRPEPCGGCAGCCCCCAGNGGPAAVRRAAAAADDQRARAQGRLLQIL